jgi:DNA-binding NtrC family response regulator
MHPRYLDRLGRQPIKVIQQRARRYPRSRGVLIPKALREILGDLLVSNVSPSAPSGSLSDETTKRLGARVVAAVQKSIRRLPLELLDTKVAPPKEVLAGWRLSDRTRNVLDRVPADLQREWTVEHYLELPQFGGYCLVDLLAAREEATVDPAAHVERPIRSDDAPKLLPIAPYDVALTDMGRKAVNDLAELGDVHRADAKTPVVLMTALGKVEGTGAANQRSAYHSATKSFTMVADRGRSARAALEGIVGERDQQIRAASSDRFAAQGLVGESKGIRNLKALVNRVANAPSPVLIVGETGTGKSVVARAIHMESGRRDGPFVTVNCAALPETLLEGAIFEHPSGVSSVGARGPFFDAKGGTLFLDEVSEMSMALQGRLLQVLRSDEILVAGNDRTRGADIRYLAATRRDLLTLVEEGTFREDLFFCLNVVHIRIPALRERTADIPILVEHFASRAWDRLGGAGRFFTRAALRALEAYSWPGNVSELDSVISDLVVKSARPKIDVDAVSAALTQATPRDPIEALAVAALTLQDLERRYVAAVLRHTRGSKARAATILGLDPSTLYRREKRRRS